MPPEVKEEQEEAARRDEFAWRFYGLRDLGFSYQDAHRLSDRADVVHQAEALIARGCSPLLAARILI